MGVGGGGVLGVPGFHGTDAVGVGGGDGPVGALEGADGRIALVGLGRAVDVRLQVDRGGDGDGGADAAFGGVDGRRDLFGGVALPHRDLGRDEHGVRGYVHGGHVDGL